MKWFVVDKDKSSKFVKAARKHLQGNCVVLLIFQLSKLCNAGMGIKFHIDA